MKVSQILYRWEYYHVHTSILLVLSVNNFSCCQNVDYGRSTKDGVGERLGVQVETLVDRSPCNNVGYIVEGVVGVHMRL